MKNGFAQGVGQAVEYTKEEGCQNVGVDSNIYHSLILFYDKTNPNTFKDTVKYENYPHQFLKVKSFGKYTFGIEYNKLGDYDAYIFPLDHLCFFDDEEFVIKEFKQFGVAKRK